MTAYNVVS